MSKIELLDNVHLIILKVQTLCYFMLKSDLQYTEIEIKSLLFEIMQFCLLHAILLI